MENSKESSGNGLFIVISVVIGAVALLALLGGGNAQGVSTDLPTYSEAELPEIVDGKQKASVTIMNTSYSPEVTVLRKDVPAELTFFGQTYGCGMAIISRDFWDGVEIVDYGKSETIEFTPSQVGRYKYSCSMGMYVAYIDVVQAS